MNTEAALQDIRSRLGQAKSVTVLTGAGISADSGVPTFRGAEGLWKDFRPEELASPDAFERDPTLVENPSRIICCAKSPGIRIRPSQ